MRTLRLFLVLTTLTVVACGPSATSDAGPPTDVPDRPASTSGDCPSDAGLEEVPPMHPSVDGYGTAPVELVAPDGTCRIAMTVLAADRPAERQHGLMEVAEIPAGTGMLFTYPDSPGYREHGYYMKGTLTPIDIAYLGDDGVIVDIRAMTPCDEASLEEGASCPTYPPDAPYLAALEVRAGWFDDVGVDEGWRVVVSARGTGG